MRTIAASSGKGRLAMLAAAAIVALGLAACSSDDDTTAGSGFTQALQKDYSDLSSQASALPAEPGSEPSFFDSLNPFSSSDTSSDTLAKAFSAKADLAGEGTEPEAEAANGPAQTTIRARLVRAVAAGKDQFPEQAARAQADYDCWVIYATVSSAAPASQACKTALDSSLLRLETSARPAPPPVPAPAPAPIPAPVPAPAPAPAAQTNNVFTVYFDWNSWKLTAEQLKVLTDVINSARAGGQTNIIIVGHTDTSGSADYNQKLSVRRANVVVEALVDMGARRAALHASGVGETDLAVQTGDNVREAKNRRTVVTLEP
ncbi:MAG TPA: OmpA family protein [Rhizomicrobium sp.]|nr:OmpA family protein [Rhizomicrobium sp.]